jgi:nitrile hydratase
MRRRGGDQPADLLVCGAGASAIESLLIEKGYLTEEAVDYVVSAYEKDIGPLRGTRLVARAWADPAFRARLPANASDALGIEGFVGENVMASGEHRRCPQCGRVHALLVLPVGHPRTPAELVKLVQVARIPGPDRSRAAGGAERVQARAGRWRRGSRLGLKLGHALLRSAEAPRKQRGPRRGGAGRGLVTRDTMIGTGLPSDPAS